jgi:hypothetical protein
LPEEFTAPDTIFHAQFMQVSKETPGGGKTVIAFEAYTKVPYGGVDELAAENLRRDVRDMQARRFRVGGLEDKGTVRIGGRQAGFQGLAADGSASVRSRTYYVAGGSHFITFVVMSNPAGSFAAGEKGLFDMVSFMPMASSAPAPTTPSPAAPVQSRASSPLPASSPAPPPPPVAPATVPAPQLPRQQLPPQPQAAPAATRPIYTGPRSGVLVWTGQLVRGLEVSIYGRGDIRSSITGAKFPEIEQSGGRLPVPIDVTVEGANIAIVERPAPSDEYSRLVIRATRDQKRAQVRIHWRVKEP